MHSIKSGRYRHFKGNEYQVIDVATDSESLRKVVVYRALYGEGGLWVRPLEMFCEMVERDGALVPRFQPIEVAQSIQASVTMCAAKHAHHHADASAPQTVAAQNVSTHSKSWWLYLLACSDGRTYVGITLDVAARFRIHASGKGAKFTRSNPPLAILGAQAFQDKSAALQAEYALKQLDKIDKLRWAEQWPHT